MQFREVKNRIQLLRAEYVPAERTEEGHLVKGTGRSAVRMVDSIKSYLESAAEVPKEILEKLTEEEVGQLDQHLKERAEERGRLRVQGAAWGIAKDLDTLAKNYDPELVPDEKIQAMQDGMKKLLEARRKYKRRKH